MGAVTGPLHRQYQGRQFAVAQAVGQGLESGGGPGPALAGGADTQPDLHRDLAGRLHLAGAQPMSPAAAQAGVILFAHGSRRPGWDDTIHELEQRLRQQDAGSATGLQTVRDFRIFTL